MADRLVSNEARRRMATLRRDVARTVSFTAACSIVLIISFARPDWVQAVLLGGTLLGIWAAIYLIWEVRRLRREEF